MNVNPYWGASFFEFFYVVFKRIIFFFINGKDSMQLASDEMQILVLGIMAVSCSIIGAFLVLKKITMLANSISHTLLVGVVISYLFLNKANNMLSLQGMNFNILFLSAIITSFVTFSLTKIFTDFFKLNKEASIGIVFSSLFSVGIILITLFAKNSSIGIEIMMGNADFLTMLDLKNAFFNLLINISIVTIFFPHFELVSFDGVFVKGSGVSKLIFDSLIVFLTSLTIVISFRSVGIILVLSFLVGPVLIARLFCKCLKKLIVYSSIIGFSLSFLGVAISRHLLSHYSLPLSTGAIISILIFITYLIASLLSKKFSYKIISV